MSTGRAQLGFSGRPPSYGWRHPMPSHRSALQPRVSRRSVAQSAAHDAAGGLAAVRRHSLAGEQGFIMTRGIGGRPRQHAGST
jgi:hypothetical protein